MLIFRKSYDAAKTDNLPEDVKLQIDEARELVERANKGVLSERSPITLIERVQISDTTKLVEKLIIDICRGKNIKSNSEKLEKAVICLKTSIDNIL